MKTLKKTLAVLLSVIFAFSLASITAFAEGETIYWQDYDEEYTLGSSIATGNNTFDSIGKYAYAFEAENAGLYSVTLSITEAEVENGYGYSYMISGEVENGTVVSDKPTVSSEEYEVLYYFENGETQYVCVSTEGDISDYTVSVSYIGEVIDFEIDEVPIQGNVRARIFDGECTLETGITITTSENEEIHSSYITFPFDGEAFEETNTVTASLFGCEKEITFSIFYVSDILESVTPAEDYKAPSFYTDEEGFSWYESDENAYKVIYTLKDGSTAENDYEAMDFIVTLDDGKVISLYGEIVDGEDGNAYWSVNDGEVSFVISQVEKGSDTPDKPVDDPTEDNIISKLFNTLKTLIQKLIGFVKSLFSIIVA